MRYWLDTEFNGFGGDLISLALVGETGRFLYLVFDREFHADDYEPWVRENVVPILFEAPSAMRCKWADAPELIADFLHGDSNPVIHTDWPDDIRYFCQHVITGPGRMAGIPHLSFEMWRVNAYPTRLPGAVQHNAYWDAMALRHLATGAR